MKRYTINQYDDTGQNKFESSWYGDVWISDNLLKMTIKGMPFNTQFNMDARAIPQLIKVLKEIEDERTN